jgi:hypothetical protein
MRLKLRERAAERLPMRERASAQLGLRITACITLKWIDRVQPYNICLHGLPGTVMHTYM